MAGGGGLGSRRGRLASSILLLVLGYPSSVFADSGVSPSDPQSDESLARWHRWRGAHWTPPPEEKPEPPPPPRLRRRRVRDGARPTFGRQGQFVVQQTASAMVATTHYDSSSASSLTFGFGPGADYFVVRNASIGLGLDLDYSRSDGYTLDSALIREERTTLSGNARVGYNLPLGARWSLFTRAFVGVHHRLQVFHGPPGDVVTSTRLSDTTTDGQSAALGTQLLLHPVPHFFIGWGPRLSHDFANTKGGASLDEISFQLSVGGYFGGDEPEPDSAERFEVSDETEQHLRFGDSTVWAFTGNAQLSGAWGSYAGTPSNYRQFTVSPAIDYFVGGQW